MVNALKSTIKVIFVITGSGVGGAEKILYHTIRGLNPERYTAILCTLKKKGFFAMQLEDAGRDVRSLTMRDEDTLAGWFDSLRVLILLFICFLKERPAIVHSFLFRANIIARIAAFLSGVPVVISSVRVMGGEKPYGHFIERVTSFMTDHYITVSDQVKNHLIEKSRISEKKISTIYNGVSVRPAPVFDKTGFMKDCGLKPDDRILMTAGRLHRQKGYDHLIQAMPMVLTAFPTVKLLILGEGDEEKNLKILTNSLELREQVLFMGLRPDVDRMLQCVEIFVLSSRWEGLPNAIMEAMAAGKPVVATAVGGVQELVAHGVTGVLVPPEDSWALAEAIKGLLSDEKRALAMGAAGKERVQRRFSMDAMIAQTEVLYQKLLTQKMSA